MKQEGNLDPVLLIRPRLVPLVSEERAVPELPWPGTGRKQFPGGDDPLSAPAFCGCVHIKCVFGFKTAEVRRGGSPPAEQIGESASPRCVSSPSSTQDAYSIAF